MPYTFTTRDGNKCTIGHEDQHEARMLTVTGMATHASMRTLCQGCSERLAVPVKSRANALSDGAYSPALFDANGTPYRAYYHEQCAPWPTAPVSVQPFRRN